MSWFFSHQNDEKGLKMLKTFLSRPRSRPRLLSQDQDQDLCFCPRGASRPRPWSRGLHHWKWLHLISPDHRLYRLICTECIPYSVVLHLHSTFHSAWLSATYSVTHSHRCHWRTEGTVILHHVAGASTNHSNKYRRHRRIGTSTCVSTQ